MQAACETELLHYQMEIHSSTICNKYKDNRGAINFWIECKTTYPILAPLALDLMSAPASEAYVERIFSLCGDLTVGKRNRMSTSLETRVFLKLNNNLIS